MIELTAGIDREEKADQNEEEICHPADPVNMSCHAAGSCLIPLLKIVVLEEGMRLLRKKTFHDEGFSARLDARRPVMGAGQLSTYGEDDGQT